MLNPVNILFVAEVFEVRDVIRMVVIGDENSALVESVHEQVKVGEAHGTDYLIAAFFPCPLLDRS